jgi:hypothetical protein
VAEVLVQFTTPVRDDSGQTYIARACGAEMPDGMWHGWIEFLPERGGTPLRSGRETTQPNRADTEYWATGLSEIYLEGALGRAMNPHRPAPSPVIPPPVFDTAADTDPDLLAPRTESILNPFSVYRKGEALLRSQLAALSSWHLANIAIAHDLSDLAPADLNAMPAGALVEIIVAGVRRQMSPG